MKIAQYAAICDLVMKKYYQRKTDEALILVAKKALANKLARECYRMLMRNEEFYVTRAFAA